MDPNANLKEQLEIASEIIFKRDEGLSCEMQEKVLRLAELVEAPDEWIKKDGFLPERWEKKR